MTKLLEESCMFCKHSKKDIGNAFTCDLIDPNPKYDLVYDALIFTDLCPFYVMAEVEF